MKHNNTRQAEPLLANDHLQLLATALIVDLNRLSNLVLRTAGSHLLLR